MATPGVGTLWHTSPHGRLESFDPALRTVAQGLSQGLFVDGIRAIRTDGDMLGPKVQMDCR
jgi:hypothetical protein